jgi:hypothetical protein
MTSLEQQQRGLLALIKHRNLETGDAWLRQIAGSKQMEMLAEIALWWRLYQINEQCRYTARLLRRLGRYQETVKAFFERGVTSPYIEKLSRDFLLSLNTHPDALIAAVAAFELACLEMPVSAKRWQIVWDREPADVLVALDQETEIPAAEVGCHYLMHVGADVPGSAVCTRFSHRP